MNHFTRALRLFGTPLRIEFRQDDNPYWESGRVKPVRDKDDVKRRKAKQQEQRGSSGAKN